jgi:hypothetical protein
VTVLVAVVLPDVPVTVTVPGVVPGLLAPPRPSASWKSQFLPLAMQAANEVRFLEFLVGTSG